MNPAINSDDARTPWGYEIKLLAPDADAEAALAWARASLTPDTDGAGDSPRHIRSLYFDTPDLDIYHRSGKQGRRKYRVRRCGDEPLVRLERKTKEKGRVRERRSAVLADELCRLADRFETPDWPGAWFHRDLLERRLEPVCRIDYERLARAGVVEGQPVQLTVDRSVRCAPVSEICLDDDEDPAAKVTAPGESIVEIRFAHALPAALKALLRDRNLAPRGLSKYRLAIEACGLGGHAYAR